MSEPNGAGESGNERLDRIERALHLMLDDHIQFREEHKLLLSAQVQMQGGLEELRKSMASTDGRIDALTVNVDALTVKMDALTVNVGALTVNVEVMRQNVEGMRQNFDQRLNRIEQQ